MIYDININIEGLKSRWMDTLLVYAKNIVEDVEDMFDPCKLNDMFDP